MSTDVVSVARDDGTYRTIKNRVGESGLIVTEAELRALAEDKQVSVYIIEHEPLMHEAKKALGLRR